MPVLLPRSKASTPTVPAIPPLTANPETEAAYAVHLSEDLQKRLAKSLTDAASRLGGNYFVWRRGIMSALAKRLRNDTTSDRMLNCNGVRDVNAHDSANASIASSTITVLDGPRGAGKSATLLQLFASLQTAHQDDSSVLLLYVPDAARWTTGYYPYYPDVATGDYLQPELALDILQLFSHINRDKIPTSLAFLTDALAQAAEDPFQLAIPLYNRLLDAFEEGSAPRRLIVLVDGANGLLDSAALTQYNDADGVSLSLSRLPVCRRLRELASPNVHLVAALTHSNPLLPVPVPVSSDSTLAVPNYSVAEVAQVLELYRRLGHSFPVGVSDASHVGFKAFVSGRNGRLLFSSCDYDAIYT